MSRAGEEHLSLMSVSPEATIADALAQMDRAGSGGLALRQSDGGLAGFLTDGDVRRAILHGVTTDQPCSSVATRMPLVVTAPVLAGDALRYMIRHDVNHLPVLDSEGVLVDVLVRNELATQETAEQAAARRLEAVMVRPDVPISEAIRQLDVAGTGALALCDEGRRLVGLLVDGDLRRAIIKGVPLSDPCESIAVKSPIVARYPILMQDALHEMVAHEIDHLPVVDEEGILVDFLLRRDIAVDASPHLSAVIMAGGYGKRLRPLTEDVPKPMLPVGDKPLLERTVEQLRRSGIRDVRLTTHYLGEQIVDHFGDGEQYGVKISYAAEGQPLGTAGGLRLIERPTGPFVVINGDILTGARFDTMLSYHSDHGADMTVGVRRYVIDVPFGVVECDEARVVAVREKPSITLFVNAGIYLLEPSAWDLIPAGRHFDMPDLISALLDADRTVVSFPILEYWLDIGRPEDYERAQKDVEGGSGAEWVS